MRWPLTGTLDYNILLQQMLFLRREGKWSEVSYCEMFFSLRNHPEWQRDCGIKAPLDPLVLAVEKENKAQRGKLKRCCPACSIGQRCIQLGKVYQSTFQERGSSDLLEAPPNGQEREREERDGEAESSSPPRSPVSSQTRQRALQVPL